MKYAIAFLLLTSIAAASCSGSGTSWSCTAGTTSAQLQTAVNSASDGATITFANGSYTWTSWVQFSVSKAVTLICANGATCSVTANTVVLGINAIPASTDTSKLYRISGFSFSGTGDGGCSGCYIWFDMVNPDTGTAFIRQIRIDHNTFTTTSGSAVFFCGDNASNTYCYGVMDHNTLNGSIPSSLLLWIARYNSTPPVIVPGSVNNLFLEDNVINITSLTDGTLSTPCVMDAWGASSIVFRYNTVTNCSMPVHSMESAGPQDHGGGNQNWEIYNNQFIQNSGTVLGSGSYRMVHNQGSGMAMYFNNQFTPRAIYEPHDEETLSITASYVDTGACTGYSYPCPHQPGRDFFGHLNPGYIPGNLYPIYGWNNVDTNNGTQIVLGSGAATTYVAPNRDYYDAVSVNANTSKTSPFNGTTGMGYGTLANRPDTCSHGNTIGADGARGGTGYAVQTVTGTIGASAGAGTPTDAVLYACTATNTWTSWYTPYTYPHPLVGGGVLAAPTFAPSGGTFNSSQSVTESCGVGATGCYTTNGVTPTANVAGTCDQNTYSTPFSVSTAETVKGICTQVGQTNSSVSSVDFAFVGITSYNPASKNFGNQQINTSSPGQTFVMTNTSAIGASLTFGTLTITGTNSSMFSLSFDSCSGQTVTAGNTCSFIVIFTPTSVGAKSAAVSVPSNALTTPDSLALSGTGTQSQGAPNSPSLVFGVL